MASTVNGAAVNMRQHGERAGQANSRAGHAVVTLSRRGLGALATAEITAIAPAVRRGLAAAALACVLLAAAGCASGQAGAAVTMTPQADPGYGGPSAHPPRPR